MPQSEGKHEDSWYVDELFKAITDKDEQALAHALDHSTIETMLKFTLRNGHSPLAYCCTQPGAVSQLGLVRCLLTSGLCDSEMIVDGEGHTVLANLAAHAHNDPSAIVLLEHILQLVIDGVDDDRTACYRMLKHNSLELFRMFLAVKQYGETQLFESLAWAVAKLNVKQFHLSTNLRMFVLWQLADYGYRRLSGNWPAKSTDEWKDHIDVIGDCWRVIAANYDTGTYEDVDDRLLYRLHIVHNQLYFLQHKQSLEHLPLREAIFCLAIFINIFKQCPKFEVYRFTVTKRLVVDAVRMISFQLALAKQCLASTELQLLSLMQEAESFIAERKNRLVEELRQKIELSGVGNHRLLSAGSNQNTTIKSMIQKLRKVDKHWSEGKMFELKALHRTHRAHLIELLESRLEHVQHPQNVADRIMAHSTKRTTGFTDAAIAGEIVASESFDLEHLMRGKDRRTRRRLTKRYDAMKQLHSFEKIVTTFARMANVEPTNVEVFGNCLKRVVTVLGEALKSTKSTRNMPNGRLKEAMERMLTERFADIAIFHRNNYAREFSLPRLLVDGELERRIYSELPHHVAVIGMAISLLWVLVLADARRSFYGTLVRCGTLGQLRALLIFAGVKDVACQMQHDAMQEVQKYFANAKALFGQLREGQFGRTPQFAELEQQFLVQCSIVQELEVMVAAESELNFESLRKTCFACSCIVTIRRLLHWKIDSCPTPTRLLETICTKWDPCVANLSHFQWLDPRLTWIDPTPVTTKLAMLQGALNSASESHYLARTRELIEQVVRDAVDQIEEHSLQLLSKLLQPYYENIFFLDNKWKVLESFCRRHQLPWDTALVRTLRQTDQQQLQALFDERRGKLRSILEQNDIRTVDVLHVGAIILQQTILSSLEHLQLELCEMLTAVGYFGDSFHYIKHRIPMIQGKNYRNLLAHDALSYNLLTDSGDAKLIVNAYIFANTEVRLFDDRRTKEVQMEPLRFPSLQDTTSWVEEQEQLLRALKSNDPVQVRKLIRSSDGEIKSFFCSSPNVDHYPPTCLPIVCHVQGISPSLDPSISAYLSLYIANYQSRRYDPKFLLESAVIRRDFDAAVKFLNVREPFPREEFYSWPALASHPCSGAILAREALKGKETLAQLLEHGNEQCFAQMFYLCKDSLATDEYQAIVCKAIVRGLRTSAKLLVRNVCRLASKALEWTIVLHWNDLLPSFAAKTDIDEGVYLSLVRTSIQANNVTALMYILTNERRCAADTLRECYQTASTFGRCTVLQYLLDTFPPDTLDSSVLSTAIHRAALNNHWLCVRLLLDTGAPVDVLMPGYQDAESNVLLLLVLFDQVALVRKLKTIDRSIYGTLTEHPFSVALRVGTASNARMVRALGGLGFSWLDSPTTLHEAIAQGYEEDAWNMIWSEIDDHLAAAAAATASCSDPFLAYVSVFQRWKMIAFIEECSVLDETNALCCAAQTGDSQMLRALLDRAYSMRRAGDIGVLGDIAFLVDSTIVGHCKAEKNGRWNVVSCCDDMIGRIHTFRSTALKECTIDAGAISIKYTVPAHVKVQDLPGGVSFRDSFSLIDNLHDLCSIADSLSPNTHQTMVYATFPKNATRSLHFLRIENVCCLYDMYKPDSLVIDLTNTLLHATGAEGQTVLQLAIEAQCDQELVQQLVQMGANPLLADSYGQTPIHAALDHPSRTLVPYLMDVCLQRKLRNADGLGMLDLTDGIGGNTLLHTATAGGHQTVVARLLQLPGVASTTARNIFGQTPAHIAATIPRTNTIALMKQLLDCDRTPVDMQDGNGATLLQIAAVADSIELLDLVMEYEPNLTLQPNRVALYEAIKLQHVRWAKRFLHHAIRKGAIEVTRLEDDGDDCVIMSLNCADFELSRALLEYELGHRLEDITMHDRPRIEAVLKASTAKIPQVAVELQLQLRGLNELDNFLTFLRNLLDDSGSLQNDEQ